MQAAETGHSAAQDGLGLVEHLEMFSGSETSPAEDEEFAQYVAQMDTLTSQGMHEADQTARNFRAVQKGIKEVRVSRLHNIL